MANHIDKGFTFMKLMKRHPEVKVPVQCCCLRLSRRAVQRDSCACCDAAHVLLPACCDRLPRMLGQGVRGEQREREDVQCGVDPITSRLGFVGKMLLWSAIMWSSVYCLSFSTGKGQWVMH